MNQNAKQPASNLSVNPKGSQNETRNAGKSGSRQNASNCGGKNKTNQNGQNCR